jgi:hypothetical protein
MRPYLIVALGAIFSVSQSASAQQTNQALDQCVVFKGLADQHSSQAEAIQKVIAEEAKQYTGAEAIRFLEARKKAAQSEWELAALAQEAYRKCMRDYVGAKATLPSAQPSPTAKAAPVVPATRAKSAPVRAESSKPSKRAPKSSRIQPQPEERVYSPGIGILPLGLGILGIGRSY